VQDPEGEGKIVYLFLPLYKVRAYYKPPIDILKPATQRGNLQDAINAHSINGSQFPEKDMVQLFKGTCEAIRAMHDHRAPVGSNRKNQPSSTSTTAHRISGEQRRPSVDDDDDGMFPTPHGDEDGGYSYHGAGAIPLVNKRSAPAKAQDRAGDEDEEEHLMRPGGGLAEREAHSSNGNASGETEHFPWAHRDMKPAYVSFLVFL
jgi:serine/threonine kinase 16